MPSPRIAQRCAKFNRALVTWEKEFSLTRFAAGGGVAACLSAGPRLWPVRGRCPRHGNAGRLRAGNDRGRLRRTSLAAAPTAACRSAADGGYRGEVRRFRFVLAAGVALRAQRLVADGCADPHGLCDGGCHSGRARGGSEPNCRPAQPGLGGQSVARRRLVGCRFPGSSTDSLWVAENRLRLGTASFLSAPQGPSGLTARL